MEILTLQSVSSLWQLDHAKQRFLDGTTRWSKASVSSFHMEDALVMQTTLRLSLIVRTDAMLELAAPALPLAAVDPMVATATTTIHMATTAHITDLTAAM